VNWYVLIVKFEILWEGSDDDRLPDDFNCYAMLYCTVQSERKMEIPLPCNIGYQIAALHQFEGLSRIKSPAKGPITMIGTLVQSDLKLVTQGSFYRSLLCTVREIFIWSCVFNGTCHGTLFDFYCTHVMLIVVPGQDLL